MVKKTQDVWAMIPDEARKWVQRGMFVGGVVLALATGAWGSSAIISAPGVTEAQVGGIVGDSLRPIRAELAAQRDQGDEIIRHLEFWSCDRSAQIDDNPAARETCEREFRDAGFRN